MTQPLWTVHEVQTALHLPVTGADVPITGVQFDSRLVQPGDIFFALVGETGNGHQHVAAAVAAGAVAVVVSEQVTVKVPTLVVADTLVALQQLGQARKAQAKTAKRIAVTGSCGKTTVKEMLHHVLTELGFVTHVSEGSFNNHYGVPLTLARMPKNTEIGVFEIGTNHPGEIGPLAQQVEPEVALVTTVAPSHIGHFADLADIAVEKLSIVVPSVKTWITPDNIAATYGHMAPLPATTVGPQGQFIQLSDVKALSGGQSFTAQCDGAKITLELKIAGEHMAMNALLVLAAVSMVGGALTKAAQALASFQPVGGRGQVLSLNGVVVVDESYNANPASMVAALQTFMAQPGTPKIVLLGDMLELGDEAAAYHADLATHMQGVDEAICVGPLMQHLHDALPTGMKKSWVADQTEIDMAALVARLTPGTAVLIKGSKKMFWAHDFVLKLMKLLENQKKMRA